MGSTTIGELDTGAIVRNGLNCYTLKVAVALAIPMNSNVVGLRIRTYSSSWIIYINSNSQTGRIVGTPFCSVL